MEVIVLFVVGTLGRRLLDSWMQPFDLADWLAGVIKVLFVIGIIAAAIAGHLQLTRYLVEKGWLDDSRK